MLTIIVATLFISLICNILLKKIHLPTIIGYIVTGVIVAYGFGLHNAVHNHELKEIAEFGVVFLMFTIGLEFSLESLKRRKHEVFSAGSAQVLITSIISFLICHYIIGLDAKYSVVLGLAVALSSTAIVLKTFNETGEINKRFGQRALGILIMQDIAVIPILLLLGFLATQNLSVGAILLETLVEGTVLLLILFLIGKYLLQPFFEEIAKTRSEELFVSSILFMAIGASYLAHELDFSYSLGAFIAGMLISETKFKHQAEADLIPFRDLLLGIFFITVGMQVDFAIILDYLWQIIVILLTVFLLKFLIIYGVMRVNENKRTSFLTALSLFQIGEFSLALLELARSSSLIAPPYGQIMIVTIVLSMIITPFILRNLTNIADIFYKQESAVHTAEEISEFMNNHIVIIGYGEFSKAVAEALKTFHKPYIIIENNLERYKSAINENQPIIYGNATKKEVLRKTHLQYADKVIIAINNISKMKYIIEQLSEEIESKQILAKVHSFSEKEKIGHYRLGYIIIENELSGQMAASLVTDQIQQVLSKLEKGS